MGVVSHRIIGRIVPRSSRAVGRRNRLLTILAAAIPDLPVAFVYLLLGLDYLVAQWRPRATVVRRG